MIRCCKDCKERHQACHDTCEVYQQEKTKDDAVKKARQLDCEYNVCAKNLAYERKRKWQKQIKR